MNSIIPAFLYKRSCILLLYLGVSIYGNAQTMKKYRFEEPKMGSPFQVILYSADSAAAQDAAQKAYALVDSLNLVFSDYEPESELSRLSRTSGRDSFAGVSPLLFGLLRQSREAWLLSGGKFDITIGALSTVWRQARKSGQFPDQYTIEKAKAQTGMAYMRFDSVNRRVNLSRAGLRLDLGGIAKGLVAQMVFNDLKENGFPCALVDAGGDIACGDAPPGKEGWSVAVAIPEREDVLPTNLVLANRSVATSGNVYQYIEHAGKKYSHEIDPQTGYGIQRRRSVTVVSEDGALSDWLATACSFLRIRAAKKLATRCGAQLLILEMRHGKLKRFQTKGFSGLWQKNK